MNFFKTPKSNFSTFQETAKFNFVWRIAFVFTLVSLLMSFYTYIKEDGFFVFYILVFFFTLMSLFFLARFKTYTTIIRPLLLAVSIILIITVTTVPDALHVQESLWMVVLILTAFFILGNGWGIFYLILNSVLYFIYYNYLFVGSLDLRLSIDPESLFLMSFEFIVSMFLIGFVMFQYGLVNKHALKNSTEAFEQLRTEKQIVEHQNKEKTVLLQEIHHRVKNNLQVIVSLLRIQSRELKSEEAKTSFQDAITRILTMSLIHQKMYEKESLMNIDIKDYLTTLIKNLIDSTSVNEHITYSVESSLKSVSAKSIVPLGLIINELVNNSLKHAFDKTGRIELKLSPGEEKNFTMTYYDSGSWKENKNATFGTQLIGVFTEQLEGFFKRHINENGTYYHFSLKEEN